MERGLQLHDRGVAAWLDRRRCAEETQETCVAEFHSHRDSALLHNLCTHVSSSPGLIPAGEAGMERAVCDTDSTGGRLTCMPVGMYNHAKRVLSRVQWSPGMSAAVSSGDAVELVRVHTAVVMQ